jgi:hypothetical protein
MASSLAAEQGCQIFLDTTYQNGGKIYQMTAKYTKWTYNISNGRKIDPIIIKYTFSIARPSKIYPKLGFLV